MPNSPQHDAGMRIEPPPSEPWASGIVPAATAAAAPPDEPPGVCSGLHGLRHAPFSTDSVTRGAAELGRVRLPEHDEAGVLDPPHDRRVVQRHVLGERARRERRANARGLVQILDEDRHAAERAVARLGREGLLEAVGDEEVELRVRRLDPRDRLLGELARRDLAVANPRRELESVRQLRASCRRRATRGPASRARCVSLSTRSTLIEPRIPFSSHRSKQRRAMPGATP